MELAAGRVIAFDSLQYAIQVSASLLSAASDVRFCFRCQSHNADRVVVSKLVKEMECSYQEAQVDRSHVFPGHFP